jgi:hypothetical protein
MKHRRPCAHFRTSRRGKRYKVNPGVAKKVHKRAIWTNPKDVSEEERYDVLSKLRKTKNTQMSDPDADLGFEFI